MSPQMSAGMAVFHSLLLMFAVLALGTTLYLEARTPKNAWKKRPIPSERPAPHIGTYAVNQLLRDADLAQTFRMHPQRAAAEPAQTEETAA